MSLDVSGLANYTEQNKMALITKAVFGAKTISLLTPMTGIKSAQTINILDTDAVFQVGGTCGFNASGTTAITQRTVTVGKIKVHEALCPKTLEAKYTQTLLAPGSQYEGVPFEQIYSDLKVKSIQKQMETAIWQGDTTSGTANLSKFDGIIKMAGHVSSATGLVNVNAITGLGTVSTAVGTATVTGVGTTFVTQGIAAGDKLRINGAYYVVSSVGSETSITLTANAGVLNSGVAFTFVPTTSANFTTPYTAFTGNAVAIMQSIAATIPVEVVDEAIIFIGLDQFRVWTKELTTANLFHYTADTSNFELVIPGTNIKVVAVNGLNGTNKIFAFRTSNAFYGTDLMNEEDQFKIFFAQEADEVRYMAEWKAGFNFAFLNEVTQFTLA
jgi:protein-L-isoaspartate O-methyltransferase